MALLTSKAPVAEEQYTPPDGRRLVFIGGAPRSGTTLLQHILDSHPAVFGGPEFERVPAIIEAWRAVVDSSDRGRINVFCDRGQIDAAFASLIEGLLLPAADLCKARLLSEKTPFNVLVFTDLLELFPRCRAIHIVRDPRAVIASLLNVGKRASAKNETVSPWALHVEDAIELVKRSLKSGFQAQQLYPDRVLTLTYEALVAEPEPTVRQLCAFLDIDFNPPMLEPHTREHPSQAALVQKDDGTWLDPNLGFRAIETSRVNVWQDHLNVFQIAAVNYVFQDHSSLLDLGYQLE